MCDGKKTKDACNGCGKCKVHHLVKDAQGVRISLLHGAVVVTANRQVLTSKLAEELLEDALQKIREGLLG
jgi:hypothetical protein